MDPVYNAIGWLLALFYSFVPNLGIAIILLTVTVMLILFPLTAKQAKSMIAMQRLQPEIKKLQAKYKGDKQKLNEELMKFYQENKVNPLAGCLPLLIQMPIFFALFHVLRNAQSSVPEDSSLHQALSVCGRRLDCAELPGSLTFLGMDLRVSALGSHAGFMDALPYFLLVAAVVVTGIFQARQTTKNAVAGTNPQMLMVGRVLPIAFGIFSLNFPAGLVLYFFTSNLWRLGQQELILRRFGSPANAAAVVDAASREISSSGPTPAAAPAATGSWISKLLPRTPDPVDEGPSGATGSGGDAEKAKPPAKPSGTRAKPTQNGKSTSSGPSRPQGSRNKRKRR